MRKMKRFSGLFVCLILVIAFCCQGAAATVVEPRSSQYLSSYGSTLSATSSTTNPGFDINFNVVARQISDYVGVKRIEVYKTSGTHVATVYGSVSNGLLRENTRGHMNYVTLNGTVGETYYAVLTMYAERDGGSDSKTYTTKEYTVPEL